MATSLVGPYDVWLTETLTAASSDIDTDVFVSYIIGILDDDTPDEEKTEGITELLSGVVEPDVAVQLCSSIMGKWAEENESRAAPEAADKGEQLSTFLGQQTLATVKEKKLTKEEKERKAAILAQYAQVSDGEESEEEVAEPDSIAPVSVGGGAGGGGGKAKGEPQDPLLLKNINKDEVARAEKEMREKARQEVEKKKEKDKQDRQTQKQKQQDRKDSEKKRTQKGEKRR